MTAREVYEKYKILPNLQQHLLRVTSLADFVQSKWQGPGLNKKTLLKSTLLHDLGSIVKFNLDNPEFYGSEAKNIEYWREVKKETVERYGTTNEHQATESMCREIGVEDEVLYVISNCGFSNYEEIVTSNNWELKVCTHCDHRTSPDGIISLKERLEEVINRYTKEGLQTSHTSEKADFLVSLALEVEKQIKQRVNYDLDKIDVGRIEINKEKFLDYEI